MFEVGMVIDKSKEAVKNYIESIPERIEKARAYSDVLGEELASKVCKNLVGLTEKQRGNIQTKMAAVFSIALLASMLVIFLMQLVPSMDDANAAYALTTNANTTTATIFTMLCWAVPSIIGIVVIALVVSVVTDRS